ncbi:MAG TPA: nucleotide exchange factor GrpE [Erysipelotrichaceae bacterium]|nr:nucleotide exchange factor GrpE [Erysipelotrichaceae bacterium]
MEEIKNTEEIIETKEEKPKKKIKHKKDKLVDELKLRICELEGEVASLKNEYARAYADTENMKRRLNAEFETNKKYRIQSFALEILPVLDNCERALEHETSDEEYKKGVEMIYQQLMQALENEGVKKLEPLNELFDANYHQAIMSEKVEDVEPGIVIEVFQNGYVLKDRILRAAMVKVSE